ncbi:nicotinate (nicotinamide) nucleotide adenylyltransferase [Aetokthonos hydrillicola Thurmond2011]|jgi:nicotinate-nucleotide adenylyltransferase|uniref:Probable nicotinate-nucleotide adenylyltransferase n=1 Tax=Aetokthonos hydrillicola Thurmond2011 TaxID=2712845 RepID=A0AAP5IBR0_9CYAN|nr:nicotinate (nicotinamide) nucleotide adenylyltransferase [Aetokthonos hydrillicola]MBO3463187.1 nicotinate (nicotinamide) nucleotide adenylyltransferase [Aetokthonos hydrillicola CCALA 1050]MBW4584206.1 nicotinate (nicotinamide) nucleotide adenylyltransferase [Aetokthonos hydrillicola CCALA 1050]MDR9898586.1 nicotinate (nicotinamide) nucleotide adenylyltransferase [Aetokthonos hydrillicola Thurmond2011]
MRQIAIFGGTFDPVHFGHLIVAETALLQTNLEQIIWVPSLNPPHKQAALFEHRLEMLQKATTDNPAFTVSLVDVNCNGNSYAINTFLELSTLYINTHWYWIVGLDTFQTLPRWYRIAELAQQCDWLIAPRPLSSQTINESELICKQVEQNLTQQLSSIHWQLLHIPLVGISSSLVRKRCRDRQSIRYLVPESVRAYIAKHNLYQE